MMPLISVLGMGFFPLTDRHGRLAITPLISYIEVIGTGGEYWDLQRILYGNGSMVESGKHLERVPIATRYRLSV